MIRRFLFGHPLETEAVPQKPAVCQEELPGLIKDGDTLSVLLKEEDIVYGLGEQVRGINKRGWIYESNCSDDALHLEDKSSLYGAHNFLVISGKRCVGIFVDTPGKVVFDAGYTRYDRLEIRVPGGDFELYVIDGADEEEIIGSFRALIGKSYIPPKWAFGYGQSRWGYRTADDVREVAKAHRENHIPLDSIYLDIDYMERYKDFTVDEEAFPDFPAFVEEMKEQGIRLVPIIDAGVKVEDGYPVYEEGRKNGYFCKDADGREFTVGVWPGKCHFPDVLNEDARRWFGEQYKVLLDQGIEGFWNDMNEPAIFYSMENLENVMEKCAELQSMNLDIHSFFEFQGMISSIANNAEDYRRFYHNYKGERVRHDRVHNLFGYNMTRAAAEAFERLAKDQRILLFSRSSYIGMHRYGGVWTGDNASWWQHLLINLKMMPSLNMCGFLYTGADVGGFGANVTEDLLMRWLALGIFMPLFRNHSALGTRRQEIYQFPRAAEMAGIVKLRYRLLPYLYSEYLKAAHENKMYARPLGFVWREDETARRMEDQMMIGESIMIAPVYEQNARGRAVYLPEEMKLLLFHGCELAEELTLPKGLHYIQATLGEIAVFIRKGRILPLARPAETVADVDWEDLSLFHYEGEGAHYVLWDDDGTPGAKPVQREIEVF